MEGIDNVPGLSESFRGSWCMRRVLACYRTHDLRLTQGTARPLSAPSSLGPTRSDLRRLLPKLLPGPQRQEKWQLNRQREY